MKDSWDAEDDDEQVDPVKKPVKPVSPVVDTPATVQGGEVAEEEEGEGSSEEESSESESEGELTAYEKAEQRIMVCVVHCMVS